MSISTLFESSVRRFGKKTSLLIDGVSYTYEELDAGSNQVSCFLRGLGVNPDEIVAISASKSFDLFCAILGVARAGAAFFIIDKANAIDWNQKALDESRARILVHDKDSELRHCLKVNLKSIKEISNDAVESKIDLADKSRLAYAIFTSGSTGAAKCVLIENRGLAPLAKVQQSTFNLGPDRRIMQYAPLCFDAFIWELSMAFFSGSTLCVSSIERNYPGRELAAWMETNGVQIITLPPSNLSMLGPVVSLDTIITAGEELDYALARKWMGAGRRFFNAYGPTEATICSNIFEVKDAHVTSGSVPIGDAIEGSKVVILDENGCEAKPGTIGELYISGPGIARGYLNTPKQNRERFLIFASRRFYRSGDLVEKCLDGSVTFKGRIDDLVKVNGTRINLADISKKVVEYHSDILRCETLAFEIDERTYIACFFLAVSEIPTESIRKWLAKNFPTSHTPKIVEHIETFPLTSNGKVDKAALRSIAHESMRKNVSSDLRGRDPIEALLIKEWTALNAYNGDTDNPFFMSGGTSSDLILLHDRLTTLFGDIFTIADLFRHTTIRSQTNFIRGAAHA